jgi:translation initiation factor 4E
VFVRAQVLAAIGEQFGDSDEICGLGLLVRPQGDRIELWTKTASNEASQVLLLCMQLSVVTRGSL